MSGGYVQADLTELENFVKHLHTASVEFKKDMAAFLDGVGFDMLQIIQDEIIRLDAVDTRLLLKSFHKGDSQNIYQLNKGDLTLTIGTNVEYAAFVNDGHWLNPQGVEKRFVPGYWSNGRFIYQRGAKTGMLLKQRYIDGKHYMEHAIDIMNVMFPQFIERKLEEWFSHYFSD